MNFEEIDKERRRQGRSVFEVCRSAGVAYPTYWRLRSGKSRAQKQTLERLRTALALKPGDRLRGGRRAIPAPLLAIYKIYLWAIAAELGVDPQLALGSDPGQRATASPEWRAAARAREIAVYCVVTVFGVPGAQVGAAIGITRQGVNQMIRRVADERETPEFESLLARVGKIAIGSEER